jgi:bifunctional ADP-heptose synthase (sugar kinase/adenylyltransferase)
MARKILVVGDVMLDKTTTVTVRGTSPENSGVLVVNNPKIEYGLGGAGNVARGCKALGADPILLGYNTDQHVDTLLKDACIRHLTPGHHTGRTPVKDRIITGDGHMLLRLDTESHWGDGKPFWTGAGILAEAFRGRVFDGKEPKPVVGVVDYDKGTVCEDASQVMMKILSQVHETFRMPLIVDPGRHGDWKRFSSDQTIFKVNAKQCYQQYEFGKNYRSLIPMPEHETWDAAKPTETCADLLNRTRMNLRDQGIDFAYVVITMGPSGIIVGSKVHSQVVHFSSEYVHAPDVCGAGDTVMATLLSFFALQDEKIWEWGTMVAAVRYAQIAAQAAVRRRGVVVVRKEELGTWPANTLQG